MKTVNTFFAVAAFSLLAMSTAHARVLTFSEGGNKIVNSQPAQKTDSQLAAGKAAWTGGRAAAGAAGAAAAAGSNVGAVAKKIIPGAGGTAIGIILTPSRIGCQAERGC